MPRSTIDSFLARPALALWLFLSLALPAVVIAPTQVDLTNVNYKMDHIGFFSTDGKDGVIDGLFEQALQRLDVRIPDVLSTPWEKSQKKNINEVMA